MDKPEPKPRNWKKIAVTILAATIIPGGFIALGIYGIKKMMDKKKDKDGLDS